ncbi:MAG: D-2-hydroxyacid dehydrogenase [Acutalibacteraceae bacterium]|nr:D-2-hydroxyacid dehydrogenase [Acutalibacteraceae bacterium]
MKIVITDASTVTSGDISFDVFSQFGEVLIYDLTDSSQLKERIKDADILLCNKTLITKEALSYADKLKYIGLFATGFNNIDLDAAKEKEITVCNVPHYSTEAVAQHTFALILEIACRVSEYNKTVKEGDWVKSRTFSYFPIPLFELSGKTIGLVGLGSIGSRVADIALAFGMNVLVYKRSKTDDKRVKQVSLDELLSKSDIVSMHCPLNSESEKIMDRDAFAKMKDKAVFINTARGGLVDEYALKEALVSGKLLGAGLDVLCREPMDINCPLLNVENCIITPHIAWAGIETRERLMRVVTSNIDSFLKGKPVNTVN